MATLRKKCDQFSNMFPCLNGKGVFPIFIVKKGNTPSPFKEGDIFENGSHFFLKVAMGKRFYARKCMKTNI